MLFAWLGFLEEKVFVKFLSGILDVQKERNWIFLTFHSPNPGKFSFKKTIDKRNFLGAKGKTIYKFSEWSKIKHLCPEKFANCFRQKASLKLYQNFWKVFFRDYCYHKFSNFIFLVARGFKTFSVFPVVFHGFRDFLNFQWFPNPP